MNKESMRQEAVLSKYQIELSFLEITEDLQAEEEIITLLKRNFLAKITSDTTDTANPQSNIY